ncbi:MAG: amino acid deaminase/aldolase [Gammaproteobacteria bacterium]|nr:MAG: amino acid deaminase/aldolase [Gammaproteobacteria bacterium]
MVGKHNTDADYASWVQAAGNERPAAVVDLDAVERNLDTLVLQAGGKPLRLVTKSIRCREVLAHCLHYLGHHCAGLMAYHPAEAAWLSGCFNQSILIAYPSLNRRALSQALQAVGQGADITFMVDSAAHLQALASQRPDDALTIKVAIDLDLSSHWPRLCFGVQRSSVRDVRRLRALVQAIQRAAHFRLVGVLGYEAQIAGVPDALPGKPLHGALVPGLKRLSQRHVRRWRYSAVKAIQAEGIELAFVNGGGTGSVAWTAGCPEVTEVAVGSGVFAPHLFDHYASLELTPAAGFVLSVDRYPEPGVLTCGGGGYVASGAADSSRLPRPVWPTGARLLPLEGAGEVQTPVRAPLSSQAESVVFRHAKAGELCERFDSLILHRGGKAEASASTYRGEGRTFI